MDLGKKGTRGEAPRGWDEVYATLRAAIVNGELEPGERLVERVLAERLQVSRTPLREALRLLEAEKLVRRLPRGGLVVSTISAEGLAELWAVRAVLEGLQAKEAAKNATSAQIREMRFYLELEAESADHQEGGFYGRKFHRTIWEASKNRLCSELLLQLEGHIDRYRTFNAAGNRIPRPRDLALKEHQLILACIERRDPDEAENAMRRHIEESGRRIADYLSDVAKSTKGKGGA